MQHEAFPDALSLGLKEKLVSLEMLANNNSKAKFVVGWCINCLRHSKSHKLSRNTVHSESKWLGLVARVEGFLAFGGIFFTGVCGWVVFWAEAAQTKIKRSFNDSDRQYINNDYKLYKL